MRVYKHFYMIFVLMRACLWNVSSSFARDGHSEVASDNVTSQGDVNKVIQVAGNTVLYAPDISVTENQDFLRTQVSRIATLPVFCRDKIYNQTDVSGKRARFLKLLLFPNHSFG